MKKSIWAASIMCFALVSFLYSGDDQIGSKKWLENRGSSRLTQPEQTEVVTDEEEQSRKGFKIFGGVAMADITHSSVPEVDPDRFKESKMGFLGGIGYEFGSRFGAEIDLLYFQKGVMFQGSFSEAVAGFNGNFKGKAFIDELSALILAKLRIKAGPTPYIIGGGEMAYILSTKGKYEFNNTSENQSQSGTEDYTEGVNRFDYGLVFGLGLELEAGPVSLFIEGRYHLGLADIAGTDEEIPELKREDWVRTNAIAVILGVKL
jgi:hypothetical protein